MKREDKPLLNYSIPKDTIETEFPPLVLPLSVLGNILAKDYLYRALIK